jgi:hypothetical protein
VTIWVVHQELTSQQEAHIHEQPHVKLLFGDMPDLSMVKSEGHCRRLLQALYPGDPPETLQRKSERIWKLYGHIALEDIMVVPLPSRRAVALAEVTGHYVYRVTQNGGDEHCIPVKWYPDCPPIASFGTHAGLFARGSEFMNEVTQGPARIAIRERLPHRYNRFAKWKWLFAGVMVITGLMRFLTRH